MSTSPVDRAVRAAAALLAALADSRDTDEREQIARVIARLTGAATTSLTEQAMAALREGT